MVVGNQRSTSYSLSIFDWYTVNCNWVNTWWQNICGIKGKTDELIGSISPNFPHILCFSEHHLKTFELEQISIDGFW